MNQTQRGLLMSIIFLFSIAFPNFYGIRMIQQRQQKNRAVVDHMRQEQLAQMRKQQEPVTAPALSLTVTVAYRVPWTKPQHGDGQIGKAAASDLPRVRLERVGHLPGEVGDAIPDLVVSGKYAYLTQQHQLRVIDLSEPTKPHAVVKLDNAATVRSISGTYIYVT